MDPERLDSIRLAGIIGAVLYLAGAGGYLGLRTVRWVRRTAKPRERVVLLLRGALAFALLHGATLLVGAALFALLARLLSNRLDAAERDQFVRNAWFCLACGSALAAAALAGLRLTTRGAPAEANG